MKLQQHLKNNIKETQTAIMSIAGLYTAKFLAGEN